MNTAKKIYESDDQGIVHVDVHVDRPGQRVEVLVVWEDVGGPFQREQSLPDDIDDGPSMADLVGLLQDVDLERPAQGEYERRDPLE